MNKKEMLNLIKEKADEKQIPNLSTQILEKMDKQIIPVTQEAVIPYKKATLKPIYAALSTVLALVIVLVGLSALRAGSLDLFADANFSDSVALSLIATSYQLDESQISNQEESYSILLAGSEDSDLVENQIDDVLSYAYFMEIFLKHEGNYETKIIKSDDENYKKMITFTLYNLLDEQMIYELYYNEDADQMKGTYQVSGLLINGKNSTNILINGVFDDKQYTLTYQLNDLEFTDIQYQYKDMKHSLSIKMYKNNVINQELLINYDDYKSATLSFIQGRTKGSYQFELDGLQDVKNMKIRYEIGQTDSGMIDLELSNEEQGNYILNIKPNNRPAFVVEKDRDHHSDHNHGKQNSGKR